MQNQDSCCSDSAAQVTGCLLWIVDDYFIIIKKVVNWIFFFNVQLPLFLYLLRELHHKLDCFTPGKQFSGRSMSAPVRFTTITVGEFLSKIRPLFPSLRKHLDSAVCLLKEG